MAERVSLMKHTFKQWMNYVGVKFVQNRQLTDEQETFLEEMIDFYSDYADRIEQDKSFLKKVSLDPIQFPQKKIKNN
jgi:hypothetical protein